MPRKKATGGRPYPFDYDRKQRVERAMFERGVRTARELAARLGLAATVTVEVINGTRRSPPTESKIAEFFGLPPEALFPPRTTYDLLVMSGRFDRSA